MSQAEIRDLALVRDTELSLVQQALNVPWRAWAHAWGLDLPVDAALVASSVSSEPSADQAGLTWQAVSTAQGLAAWVHVPAGWRTKLAAQLVGRSTKAPMPDEDFALAAADRAQADLLQRWRQALLEPTASPGHATPDQAWSSAYSGALLLTEPRSGLLCLLGRAAYRALLPKAAAPVATPSASLLRTLAQHRLPVTLGLGEVEIPMSDLLGLQTGDVIQFPTRLSDDLPLTLAAQVAPMPALRCQLGQLDGRLAVKVVAKAKTTA